MTTPNQTHTLIETDVATINCHLQYDAERNTVKHIRTTIGNSIDSHDTDITCSCGSSFETRDNAEQHLKDHATPC